MQVTMKLTACSTYVRWMTKFRKHEIRGKTSASAGMTMSKHACTKTIAETTPALAFESVEVGLILRLESYIVKGAISFFKHTAA